MGFFSVHIRFIHTSEYSHIDGQENLVTKPNLTEPSWKYNWNKVVLSSHLWLPCDVIIESGLYVVYSSLSCAVLGNWQYCDLFHQLEANARAWRQNTCLEQEHLLANLFWGIAETHAGWRQICLFIGCFHGALVNRKIFVTENGFLRV